MGSTFHRLVMAAMAAGLLVIPGCGAADGKSPPGTSTAQDPPAQTASAQPTIVSASIDGTGTLKVAFSEAMAPATGVDPAKFRLTIGYYTRPGSASGKYSYNGKYTYTGGAKLPYAGGAGGTKLPYAGGKYYGGGYKYAGYGAADHTIYSDIGAIASIKVDPDTGTFAELPLGTTFDLATECQEIAAHNAANPNAHAGLYLHYTSAGTPTIEDPQGNKLASLAAYWASDPTLEQVSGDFAGKPIPVSISCP
jgi:hypothetical protein